MKKFFIPCSEANHVCDKNQYKDASFRELIKLNIHLMYCGVCRKYSASNTKLSKLFKNNKTVVLEQSAKNALQQQIENQLKNQ